MKSLFTLSLLFLFGQVAYAQPPEPIVVHENDSIRLEYTLVNANDSTYSKKMFKHNILIESLFLRDRKRVNEYTEYYDNGNILGEGRFDSLGKYTSTWKRYYKDKQLANERNYSNGGLKGNSIFYYKNGNKKAEGQYDHELYELHVLGHSMDNLVESKIGLWTYYHPSGAKASEGNYWFDEILLQSPEARLEEAEDIEFGDLTRPWKVDLKHGVWQYWDNNGKLIKEETYDKGELLEIHKDFIPKKKKGRSSAKSKRP
ncbi:MAG: hypothetical protein GY810_19440 [Aureispira sp.]|nr:hypothetical protein [Aureispira sp.]